MHKKILYLIYIAVVGLLFTFYVPPFQKADESTHFLRTDALSKGQLYCNVDGDKKEGFFWVSKSIRDYIGYHDIGRIAFNINQKYLSPNHPKYIDNSLENEKLRDLCSFGFIGYLPNLIGYKISLLISGGNLDVIFYVGRLLPFLMYFFLVVFLSRRIKSYFIRNIFYFYSALPMVIHQVTSYSYDTLMLILTLVFIFYLDKIFLKRDFRVRDKVLFGLSLFLLANSKPGYYPFWINIFLIPNFINKKNFKREFLMRMFVFIIGIGLIYLLTYSPLPSLRFSTPNSRAIPSWVYTDINIHFILHDPLGFGKVFVDTIVRYGGEYLTGIVGIFGWLDYKLDFYVYLIFFSYFVYLCIKVINKGLDFKIGIWNYLILMISVVTTFIMVFVSLYITWTDLINFAHEYVWGPTGRYFLVIVPSSILLILYVFNTNGFKKYYKKILLIVCLLVVIYSIKNSIYTRFYDYSDWTGIENTLGQNFTYCGTDKEDIYKPIDKDVMLKCPLNGQSVYAIGFKYISPDKIGSYRIEILDNKCNKVLFTDYPKIYEKSVENEYKMTFDLQKTSQLCIRIVPFYIEDNEYLRIKGTSDNFSIKLFSL